MTRPRSALIYCLRVNASRHSSPGVCRTASYECFFCPSQGLPCLEAFGAVQGDSGHQRQKQTTIRYPTHFITKNRSNTISIWISGSIKFTQANTLIQAHQGCINKIWHRRGEVGLPGTHMTLKSLSLNNGWLLGQSTVNGDAPVE